MSGSLVFESIIVPLIVPVWAKIVAVIAINIPKKQILNLLILIFISFDIVNKDFSLQRSCIIVTEWLNFDYIIVKF
jgi:hypothetical protein